MGQKVSTVRTEIREALDPSDEERTTQEERLNVLEMMVTSRLDIAKQNILNGDRNAVTSRFTLGL